MNFDSNDIAELANYKPSNLLRILRAASWCSVLAGIAVAIVGGYLIHPGLAMLVFAYYMQSLNSGLVATEQALMRRDMEAHIMMAQHQAPDLYRQVAQDYMRGGAFGGGKTTAQRES